MHVYTYRRATYKPAIFNKSNSLFRGKVGAVFAGGGGDWSQIGCGVSSNLFPLQSKPFPKLPTKSPSTFNFLLTFNVTFSMNPFYQVAYFSVFFYSL